MAEKSNEGFLSPAAIRLTIDMASFTCLALLAFTGLIVFEQVEHAPSFLGISAHGWQEMHERLGVMLLFIIAGHLFHNRKWIMQVFRGPLLGAQRQRAMRAALIALVAVVVVAVTALF